MKTARFFCSRPIILFKTTLDKRLIDADTRLLFPLVVPVLVHIVDDTVSVGTASNFELWKKLGQPVGVQALFKLFLEDVPSEWSRDVLYPQIDLTDTVTKQLDTDIIFFEKATLAAITLGHEPIWKELKPLRTVW